jgi:hypothetical protein
MLMTSEISVEAVAKNFLHGNYTLDITALAGAPDETAPAGPPAGDSR